MRCAATGLATLLLLAACAVPRNDPRFVERQNGPVEQSLSTAVVPSARARLWYVGLGMQGETWSENDVVEAAARLQQVATDFDVRPVLFSNRIAAMPERYPAVDGRSVEQVLSSIAAQTKPGDVVLVYASTHGAPGKLGRAAGGRQLAPIGTAELRRWLVPLDGVDTVVILSACFSGSFIPSLKSEHRIIFAAARSDRTSFGCQAGAEHTVFGQALLQALEPHESLHNVIDRTRDAVRAEETAQRFSPPSLPQVFVGSAVRILYDAPVF